MGLFCYTLFLRETNYLQTLKPPLYCVVIYHKSNMSNTDVRQCTGICPARKNLPLRQCTNPARKKSSFCRTCSNRIHQQRSRTSAFVASSRFVVIEDLTKLISQEEQHPCSDIHCRCCANLRTFQQSLLNVIHRYKKTPKRKRPQDEGVDIDTQDAPEMDLMYQELMDFLSKEFTVRE